MSDVLSVQAAWSAVMGDVRGLGKNNQANAGGVRFAFRGIDDVMNAVGPILRQHNVSVIPVSVAVVADREVMTSNNKIMRNVTVSIGWSIVGPGGDTLPGMSLGEASDSGDKSVSKAHSVAYRTFLIQALCLPTDEDDPDHTIHDRVQRPAQQPQAGRQRPAEVQPAELDALQDMDALEALWARAEAAGQGENAQVKAAFQAAAARIEGDAVGMGGDAGEQS